MEINLRNIKKAELTQNNPTKRIILYGDFNVLNFFYRNRIQPDPDIELYPDSTATYLLLRYFHKIGCRRIVSTDLQNDILSYAVKLEKSMYFFGDSEEILQRLKQKLRQIHPYINIAGTYPGYDINNDCLLKDLRNTKPDILFVGLGLGRQEKWISQNYRKLDIPFIISTGGWFKYLAGERRRAPIWMRKYFLEWLYKLITEFPRIWQRYLFGFPVFVYRVISKKIVLVYHDENSFLQ
jgi:N-acetylglucosaminyldiphosphoundecaprenol N-acetyl-beta-D-mannosaminyltransferase